MIKFLIIIFMFLFLSISYAKPKNCKYWVIYPPNNAASILRLCPYANKPNKFSYLLYLQSSYDEKSESAYPSSSGLEGAITFKRDKAVYLSEDKKCAILFFWNKAKDYILLKEKITSGNCGIDDISWFNGKKYTVGGKYNRLKGEWPQIPNEENEGD